MTRFSCAASDAQRPPVARQEREETMLFDVYGTNAPFQ